MSLSAIAELHVSTLSFFSGSTQRYTCKVKCRCTTASIPLSNIIKMEKLTLSWRSDIHRLCHLKAWPINKNKKPSNFLAPPPGGMRSPTTTKLGVVIEEVHTIIAPPKRVSIQCIVLPLWGAENFGQNAPTKLHKTMSESSQFLIKWPSMNSRLPQMKCG